jgi:hypothetical protein
MQVHCRCGQPFTIHRVQFPHQVSCHICGHHFNVLDTGETFVVDPPPVPKSVASVSIQDVIYVDRASPDRNAVCDEKTRNTLVSLPTATSERKLALELRLIDLQWEAEQHHLCVANIFGRVIEPSIGILILIFVTGAMFGIGCGVTAVLLFATEPEIGGRLGFMVACIGLGAALGAMDYVRVKSQDITRYREAKAAWQRKRLEFIAKYGTSL